MRLHHLGLFLLLKSSMVNIISKVSKHMNDRLTYAVTINYVFLFIKYLGRYSNKNLTSFTLIDLRGG